MSYITDDLLQRELRRLFEQAHPDRDASTVLVREVYRKTCPFIATIDGEEIKFRVPEDMLHSSPLRYVSDRYLKPLLSRPSS